MASPDPRDAPTRAQALACVPVRHRDVEHTELDDGLVQIRYPVTLRPWMARLARWAGRAEQPPQRRTLQLDRLGSEVWGLIDGRRSVACIRDVFARRHRLRAREAEVAITQFLRELGKRGVVGMRGGGAAETGRGPRQPPARRP